MNEFDNIVKLMNDFPAQVVASEMAGKAIGTFIGKHNLPIEENVMQGLAHLMYLSSQMTMGLMIPTMIGHDEFNRIIDNENNRKFNEIINNEKNQG